MARAIRRRSLMVAVTDGHDLAFKIVGESTNCFRPTGPTGLLPVLFREFLLLRRSVAR
jgi:hypothetical protein